MRKGDAHFKGETDINSFKEDNLIKRFVPLNDVFSASIASFTLWCMSSLFSGLYFPLDDANSAIKIISSLMPQKWFLDGTEMIFVGDNKVFGMLICITAAYLIITLSLGSIGLKVRRSTEWGVS